MRSAGFFPARFMRAQAQSQFTDTCEIWRNDGYGWGMVGKVGCNIHHRITPPSPADPRDASGANAEFVEVHHAKKIPSRIGDQIRADGKRWTIGGGNLSETYASFNRALAARPIAATPRVYITLRRINYTTNQEELVPPQLVHVAWTKNQPDRLAGISLRQFGWIFAPEEADYNLDVRQGDTFFYGGVENIVEWVQPDPTDRREATFFANVGEGT